MYAVKEIFYTLQGEGANAGRPAVFCRFAGCNLWSGLERDRETAQCTFCDTDFVGLDGPGGGRFANAEALAQACADAAGEAELNGLLIVLTGGEPMLQLDAPLVNALHAKGFQIAIETNGTLPVISGLDWVCVSPKAGTEVVQRSGDELKLVFPQAGLAPSDIVSWPFAHRYLQPMDGPSAAENTAAAISYCKGNPQWRLSLQTHKLLGIP